MKIRKVYKIINKKEKKMEEKVFEYIKDKR